MLRKPNDYEEDMKPPGAPNNGSDSYNFSDIDGDGIPTDEDPDDQRVLEDIRNQQLAAQRPTGDPNSSSYAYYEYYSAGVPNKGSNDTPVINIEDEAIMSFIDSMSSCRDERKYFPLTYSEREYGKVLNSDGIAIGCSNRESFPHRGCVSKYHLRIGDSLFFIPPEFINIQETSSTVRESSIRATSTMKKKTGYSTTDMVIKLVFNGDEQINGFEIESPFGKCLPYYVDGLRSFLAQCRVSPIMPIENEFLNKNCGIYSIVVQNVQINTVEGFPKLLECTLMATEFYSSVYTMAPVWEFSNLIEWDLYRYNYQRLLRKEEFLPQSLPAKVDDSYKLERIDSFECNGAFDIYMPADEELELKDNKEIERNIRDVKKFKYKKILSSYSDDFFVSKMSFGFENIIVTPKLSNASKPIAQYLGGGDSAISIQILTRNSSTVSKFKDLIARTQYIIKKLKDCSGIGFVKIDNPFLNLVGSNFLLIDSVTLETVPEFPGLFNINIHASSHDIFSTKTEELNGFRPFLADGLGTKDDSIFQNPIGLMNKIGQEAYVEHKMSSLDLYPDLMLPSYKEVDAAITKINEFRIRKNMPKLPFSEYPRPVAKTMLYDSPFVCDHIVDPDFYFMYPQLDTSLITVKPSDLVTSTDVKAVSVENVYKNTVPPGQENTMGGGGGDNTYITNSNAPTSCNELGIATRCQVTRKFLDYLLSKIGCGYVFGAYGQMFYRRTDPLWTQANENIIRAHGTPLEKWRGKQVFDCSGFVGHGMWHVGYFKDPPRLYHEVFKNYCTPVNRSDLSPGDILIGPGHIAIFCGGDSTVEAMNSNRGVVMGNVGNRFDWFGRINWKPEQYLNSNSNSNTSAPSLFPNDPFAGLGNGLVTPKSRGITRAPSIPGGNLPDNLLPPSLGGASGGSTGGSSSNESVIAPPTSGSNSSTVIGKWGGDYDRFDDIILGKCNAHGVNPNWIKALMRQESNMNPTCVSGVGAVGLLQVMEPICNDYGISFSKTKFYEPDINIEVGTRYIKQLHGMFGTYLDAISAYNCGQGRWQQVLDGAKSMPSETKKHREKVQGYYDQLIANGGTGGGLEPGTNGSSAGPMYDIFHNPVNQYITKQHGNRKVKNDGHFGVPIPVNSPFNKLFLEYVEKKGTLTGGNDDLFGDISTLKQKIRDHVSMIKKEYADNSINNTYAKGYYDKCVYNQKVLRDLSDVFDIDVETSDEVFTYKEYHKLVGATSDSTNNFNLISSTVDEGTYNCRGTMLKAFPTYSFMISTDNANWFDGKKLWNNYYPYKSIMSISVAHDHEQPVGTAHIVASNMSQNLNRYPELESYKTISDDDEYSKCNKWLYESFGFIVGTPKITESMIESHNNILEEMKLQAGARIHIRLGYGNSFAGLPIVFNGTIAEVSANDYIEIVAQSDGLELINSVVSKKQDQTNTLMKLQQEPSNIITSLLIDRASWTHVFSNKWGEASEYNIEHFGLYLGNNEAGIFNQREYEYDLCKNVYLGTYKQELFCSKSVTNVFDGENGVEMFLFNRTPWDTMNLTAQVLPEFVAYPTYHGFDSRVFYGIPSWLYKYRYDLTGDLVVKEYCKAFSQLHLINSNDIIDNRVKVSSKHLHTNCIATYVLGNDSGNDVQTTPTMFADKSIDWSKQKTKVMDTALQQNYWGPDGLYEFLSFNEGITNAECVATTGLIESFSKCYYDEVIILGNPTIKPYDEIFIDDLYGEMYGLARVNRVTHSFNANTGLTSSITPGMIAYSKSEDSGSTNLYRSKVNLMDLTCSILGGRFESVAFADEYAKAMYYATYSPTSEFREEVLKSVMNLAPIRTTDAFVDILKTKSEFVHENERKDYITRIVGNDMIKGLSGYSGTSATMKYLARIPLVRGVAGYFVHDNCIGIRPLLHKGRPFVSGIKGSKNIMDGFGEMPEYQDSTD